MSLKSLIQWLLDSRTTPEEAAHSAMPGASNIIVSVTNPICTTYTEAYRGVSPQDGYVYTVGKSTAEDGYIRLTNDTAKISCTTTGGTGKDIAQTLSVCKGQTFIVTAKTVEDIFIRIAAPIGG